MTRNHLIKGFQSAISPQEQLGSVFLNFDPNLNSSNPRDDDAYGNEVGSSSSAENSPFVLSPWNNIRSSSPSPYKNSTWIVKSSPVNQFHGQKNGLIGSITREEGHIYSLATSRDLLYTGSDSKNIRVWKDLKEFSGFKSKSGLVKAIVISSCGKIFTGHQDGKIRIWKISAKNQTVYKRIGNLPTTKDFLKSSMNPKNYVEVRRKRNVLKIKHYDTVSCLSIDRESGLLYSGSWDKTVKVWRISDFKCLESIPAHSDAVNSIVAGFDDLLFTGSADGTVKAWRRELQGANLRHSLMQLLLHHENAVTALAVNIAAAVVYCGSSDGLLNTWEVEKQRLCHGGILRGHRMAVLCVAAAGNMVFSGGADKSICVWQRDGAGIHTCLSVLTGHNGPVKCLAVERDSVGREEGNDEEDDRRWTVYSGSLDKSVKVWTVTEAKKSCR